ncbi:putative mitochondrial protein [Cucumis melo var. makuwa]|uniref:Putative mitochondrial protein n=1 Tax=Cucumis melo var. makuwa TaxID=1194695 RepID=A0A5D3BU73_CUCMM|nr:putative mitochondrial protein [Cucumis melo var. makuwa]
MIVRQENKTVKSDETLAGTHGIYFKSNIATISKNTQNAMESRESKTTVMEEMRVLEKNKKWDICTLPKEHKTMECKWMFTLKHNSNETLDRYKAKLVAKGFT